ncbi:Ataxin-1-like [Bagarius yarrelli]|uniref:Ataxin-1-like n=1 Tax=Bagarius yarrelli TaxID=175774 RepID=A0A556VCZ2_BAGYA|nr:Ataxin-1-like [Bagarius yarrelli]
MKPAHERNQECLPPKKRDLPVNNASTVPHNNNNNSSSSSSGNTGGGDEAATLSRSSGATGEAQGGSGGGEWVRTHPNVHYGVEGPESIAPGLPVDQYSMLYKVAVPSVTYAPTSLHPVLGHISPAYTVPSTLLQHTGIHYPPLGYAPIPQFVSPPYATAVPYAVPPGFVPSPLIPAQSHLVPYSSVIQEGVVSSPPQHQVSAHAYAKVAATGGVPLVLASEQAVPSASSSSSSSQQQPLGAIGMIPTAERVSVFYHTSSNDRTAPPQSGSVEQDREVNGGDRENGRENLQDVIYLARNSTVRLQQGTAMELQDRKTYGQEGRASPSQRGTPETDLEWGVPRVAENFMGRTGQCMHRTPPANWILELCFILSKQHTSHTVILPNGQPVLMPLDYHPHPQPNNDAAAETQQNRISDGSGAAEQLVAVELPSASSVAVSPPSHFTKGAIIQLATGELKRVEDLQTQDFVRSAEASTGLKIDSSMVVDIRTSSQRPGLVALRFAVGECQSKVSIDVPPEHPFFVFGQGWSSCSPERTAQLYGLTCHHLQVGDVCVSITLQQHSPAHQKPPVVAQQSQQPTHSRTSKANLTSGATCSQPMGPPAPQNPRPQGQLRMERVHRERADKDDSLKPSTSVHGDVPSRPDRTSAEHTRSQSSYYLHTEVHGPSQRRWSTPGFQRYPVKREEVGPTAPPGSSRPSFISQEVKLSIEGRSNAGK